MMEQSQNVYCPACHQVVRIVSTQASSSSGGQASIPDTRYVCLDFGEGCEGGGLPGGTAKCPVLHAPAVVAGIERARAGLTPEPRNLIVAPCQGCGEATEQEQVGSRYSVCDTCGTTNPLPRS